MNKIKAVAVGFSCMDVYEKLNRTYPTGNGVDWGVHLSRFGIPVSVVSVTGTDQYGQLMREMLTKERIDISHLHQAEGDTCQMKMDLKNGTDRVHLEEVEGVMKDFRLTSEDKEFIKSFDYFHTDLFGNVLDDLEEIHDAGVKVVMDFSVFSDNPEYNRDDNYCHVDYAFLSYENDDNYIREHIKQIQSFGPKIVTATLGDQGSISYDGEKYYRFGIVPCRVANTVGAGDSYIAGFTYGLMQGCSVSECQKQGAELSSRVITRFEPY